MRDVPIQSVPIFFRYLDPAWREAEVEAINIFVPTARIGLVLEQIQEQSRVHEHCQIDRFADVRLIRFRLTSSTSNGFGFSAVIVRFYFRFPVVSKPARRIAQERLHDLDHGVAEAADVQGARQSDL
jgi:hypothetical protein